MTDWCWGRRRARTIARWRQGLRGLWRRSTMRGRWGLSWISLLSTFSLRFIFNFFHFHWNWSWSSHLSTFSLRYISNFSFLNILIIEVYLERCEFGDGVGSNISDCSDWNLWGKRAQCSMWWRRYFHFSPWFFSFQFIKSKLKFTFKSRFGFILPTRVDNTQTCGSKSI